MKTMLKETYQTLTERANGTQRTAQPVKQTPKPADMVQHLMVEIDRLRQQVSIQSELIDDLKKQAMEDTLTGLANRRAFEKELQRSMSDFSRYNRQGAVLLLDVNSFKSINDTLGHAAGDAILAHIARVLEAHTRTSDMVARLGGDEFALILKETNAEQASLKARELETVLAASTCRYEGHDIHVSVSIGSCPFVSAANPQAVMELADASMYRHKQKRV